MKYELLPCPFCGHKAKLVELYGFARRIYIVQCNSGWSDGCPTNPRTNTYLNKRYAIDAWNMRVK